MGMGSHAVGVVPPDEKWNEMKAIWDACEKAKIEPPKVVLEFFDYRDPDPAGVETSIEWEEWSDGNMSEGIEVEVDKIPKHVKIIRFVNTW